MFDRRLLTVLLLAAIAWTVLADAAQAGCRGRLFGRFRGRTQAVAVSAWTAPACAPCGQATAATSGCAGGSCPVR